MSNSIINLRNLIYRSINQVDEALKINEQIVVLCFHAIDEKGRFSNSLSDFKKIIKHISKTHSPISLREVKRRLFGKTNIHGQFFAVTFDDGYRSVLKTKNFCTDNNIVPTVFLIGNTKDAQNVEKRKYLTKSDVENLKAAGWEFGSHTLTHRVLTNLSTAEVVKEIVESKKIIEKEFSVKADYISYPLGRYNQRIITSAKKAGYTLGLTMDDGTVVNTTAFTIPRVGVDATHAGETLRYVYSPNVIKFRKFLKESFLKDIFINI